MGRASRIGGSAQLTYAASPTAETAIPEPLFVPYEDRPTLAWRPLLRLAASAEIAGPARLGEIRLFTAHARAPTASVGVRYRIGDQGRRVIDIVVASAAIVILAPLFAVIAAILKGLDDGAVLFSQDRIGRGGRRFRCWKFRSMVNDAEGHLARVLAADPALNGEWVRNRKLKHDPRVTQFGDFLRRSSLDELPQLFNILRGDMTLIGPRPIVEDEAPHYGRWFPYYLAVKPGLTGLWQISGRNDVSYRRRVAMDRLFCQSYSLELCLLILLGTVPAVLLRRGSY